MDKFEFIIALNQSPELVSRADPWSVWSAWKLAFQVDKELH